MTGKQLVVVVLSVAATVVLANRLFPPVATKSAEIRPTRSEPEHAADRWEYRIETLHHDDVARLDRLGRDVWELVSVATPGDARQGKRVCFFKRAK